MAKIIEARAILKGEDQLSPKLDKLAKKLNQIGKNEKTAVQVGKMAAAMAKVNSQMSAMEKFNAAKLGFSGARQHFRQMQEAVTKSARAMREAEAPTRKLEAAHRRAQGAVIAAARAFDQQRNSLLGAKRALDQHGIPINRAVAHQARLAAAVDRTNAALDRQHRRAGRRQNVGQGLAIGVGMLGVGYQARNFAVKSITSAAEFDYATRKQRELTEGNISKVDQAAILSPQAKRIGQETRFSNLDVVQAQTASMQGLPTGLEGRIRAEVGAGILENVKNYAIVMETDLKTAAETIRTYLQTTGKDITTKEKALRESQLAVNRVVRMAKLGGMTAEDVPQYLKFGAGANSVVGVDEDAFLAIGALAKLGGLPGQEAGVFMRQVAGKLASPTKKGLTAMRAAGIDYSKFVRMPDKLETGRLESQFQQEVGIGFTPEVRRRLDKVLANKGVLADRNKLTELVTKAVSPLFPTTKKGKMAASDRAKIAKTTGSFYAASGSGVDAQGLLDTLMQAPLTLQQINSILDYRQGGRFAVTQRQRDEYVVSRKLIRDTDSDPNFAKNKADEIMGGLGGSLENLKGSFENLQQSIGEANGALLKFSFDAMGTSFDWVSNLSTEGRQAATALAAIAALGSAGYIMKQLFTGFGLGGSAIALDASAAALMGAATALGGSSVAGKVAAGAAGAAGAGAAPWLARALPYLKLGARFGGPAVIAALVGYEMYQATRQYKGMTSGERMKQQRGGRSMRETYRAAFNAERERQGVPLISDWGQARFSEPAPWPTNGRAEPVKAELTGGTLKTSGQIEVTLNIPGVGVQRFSVPTSGTVDANGPGSLGTSSPDASVRGPR